MKSLIFCCFVIVNYSCNNHTDRLIDKGEFVFEVPKSKNDYIESFHLVQNTTKKFQMENLSSGYDSVFTRLWHIPSTGTRIQAVDMFRSDGQWKGAYNEIYYAQDSQSTHKKIVSIEKDTFKISKSGIALMKLDIDKMLDMYSLSKYQLPAMDDGMYIIEFATRNKYKILTYPSPQANLSSPDVQKLYEIIKEMENIFSISFIDK